MLLISCGSKLSYEEQISQYNSMIRTGDSLYNNKEYSKAIIRFTDAIKITDTLSTAFLKSGMTNLSMKNYDKAKDNYSDAINIDGEKSIGYKGRALANYYNIEYDDFIDDINIYITNNKFDIEAYSVRGDYYGDNEDYENASKDYSICIKNDPQNAVYYLKRGNVYAIEGKNDLSISDYEIYTKLTPNQNNDIIYFKRGNLNIKAENYERALNDFSQLSKSFSNSQIFTLKGDCFYYIQNYNEAIKNYTLYLNSNPTDSEILFKRGDSYNRIGDSLNAHRDYERAATIRWQAKGLLYKYGWYILFITLYLLSGVLIGCSMAEVYDNKKIKKGYLLYLFTGLLGGHYLYLKYYIRYVIQTILIFALGYVNAFNIRSFYDHFDTLWTTVKNTPFSLEVLYIIIFLLLIDCLFLPYYIFNYNHKLRITINEISSEKRESEINEILNLIEEQNNNFKSLQ